MDRQKYFLEVQCECGETIRTYEYAAIPVECPKCGKLLVKPTGGKAEILGKIVKKIIWKD